MGHSLINERRGITKSYTLGILYEIYDASVTDVCTYVINDLLIFH